jgi:hypothetical protein
MKKKPWSVFIILWYFHVKLNLQYDHFENSLRRLSGPLNSGHWMAASFSAQTES